MDTDLPRQIVADLLGGEWEAVLGHFSPELRDHPQVSPAALEQAVTALHAAVGEPVEVGAARPAPAFVVDVTGPGGTARFRVAFDEGGDLIGLFLVPPTASQSADQAPSAS